MAESYNADIKVECLDKSACAKCGAVVDLSGKEAFSTVSCPRCGGRFTAPGKLGTMALLKVLGKGQMGVTFKAFDRALGRNVAVKLMRAAGAADRKNIDDFFSEARALGVLAHPNVATIYSLVEDPDCPYIVMELLEGGSMDRQFDKDHPMEEVRALELGMGVAKALSAAQEVGLIHGDVKPGNIMLDDRGRAKLVDFGIARFGGGRMSEDDALGTPYYASPEQVLRRAVDFRTDIYSLGATLFHALTGIPPFPGRELKEVLAARLKAPAPDLMTLRPSLHPQTAAVIARMLEPKPENRYANYEDLRRALEDAYAAAAGLKAPIVETEAPARSSRPLLIVGILAVLAAAGILAAVLFQGETRLPPVTGQPSATQKALLPLPNPDIRPREGAVTGPVDVTISCDTPGAVIYYTLDGTDPTEASTKYSRSIQVAPGTKVMARAYRKGHRPSGVVSADYSQDKTALGDIELLRTTVKQAWAQAEKSEGGPKVQGQVAAARNLWISAEALYAKNAYGAAVPMYQKVASAAREIEALLAERKVAQKNREKLVKAMAAVPAPAATAAADRWKQVQAARDDGDKAFEQDEFAAATKRWKEGVTLADEIGRYLASEFKARYEKKLRGVDAAAAEKADVKSWEAAQKAFAEGQTRWEAGKYLGAAEMFQRAVDKLSQVNLEVALWQVSHELEGHLAAAREQMSQLKFDEAGKSLDEASRVSPCATELWRLRNQVSARRVPHILSVPLSGGEKLSLSLIPAEVPVGPRARKPAVPVAFYMAQYETSKAQFALFVNAERAKKPAFKTQAERKGDSWVAVPHKGVLETAGATWEKPAGNPDVNKQPPTPDNHPVSCVSPEEAEAFCKWASEQAKASVRLPTDTEWTYACRAGGTGALPPQPAESINYADQKFAVVFLNPKSARKDDDGSVYTAAVNWGKPNAWQLYNMLGNVMEICTDAGPNGKRYIIRGGSWAHSLKDLGGFRTVAPATTSALTGFRVVVTAVPDDLAFPPAAWKETPPPPPEPETALGSPDLPAQAPPGGAPPTPKTQLKVGDKTYPSGFSASAADKPASLTFAVNKPAAARFVALAGLDADRQPFQPKAAIRCRLYFDDILVATSPLLAYASDTAPVQWPFDLAVPDGVTRIRLEAAPEKSDGGTVSWVNAGLRSDTPAPPPPASQSRPPGK